MKKAQKKGFTIVELLVVIAVIAVLAAVLIPVMVYLIDDAKTSADEQVTASLNKAIAAETGNIDTMSDALEVAEEYGYGVEQLTPTSEGNLIVWDQNTKYFALVTEDGEEIYSNGTLSATRYLWVITSDYADVEAGVFSCYLADGFETTEIEATTGIDVGDNTDTVSITYTGSEDRETVIIRTNSSETDVTVDAENDTVLLYGEAGEVTITAVADESFHLYGNAVRIAISQGRAVIESGASVTDYVLVTDSTGSVVIESAEDITVRIESSVTHSVSITADKALYLQNNSEISVEGADDAEEIKLITSVDDFETVDLVQGRAYTTAAGTSYTFKNGGTGYALSGNYKLAADLVIENQLVVQDGETAVFDLNGYSIESEYAGVTLMNFGYLTFEDSSEDETGLMFNSALIIGYSLYNGSYYYYTHDIFRNYNTLTINGGTFGDADLDRTNENINITQGACIKNYATCVINGGYFTCGDNYYYWYDEVYGGWYSNYSYAVMNYAEGAEMTINGGTVYGSMNGGICCNYGTITIYDCTVNIFGSKSWYCVVTQYTDTGALVYIYGGTFIKTAGNGGILGGYSGMPSWDATDDLAANGYYVYGGTYTSVDDSTTL